MFGSKAQVKGLAVFTRLDGEAKGACWGEAVVAAGANTWQGARLQRHLGAEWSCQPSSPGPEIVAYPGQRGRARGGSGGGGDYMRISRSRHLTGPGSREEGRSPPPLSVRVPVLCLPCTELCAVSQAWNLLSWGAGGGGGAQSIRREVRSGVLCLRQTQRQLLRRRPAASWTAARPLRATRLHCSSRP